MKKKIADILRQKLKRAQKRIRDLEEKLKSKPSFVAKNNVTTTLNGHKDSKSLERFFKWDDL